MRTTFISLLLLISSFLSAQHDSVPVNKTLKGKPVPNYPDTNSIYKSPDTNAIYKEEQGYPDKENNKIENEKGTPSRDSVQLKKPVRKTSPAPRDKTKVVPKKIKKATNDTTGTGEKHNL